MYSEGSNFEVVIEKVAIYVVTEVRQGVGVAIGSAAALSKVTIFNGHCITLGLQWRENSVAETRTQ